MYETSSVKMTALAGGWSHAGVWTVFRRAIKRLTKAALQNSRYEPYAKAFGMIAANPNILRDVPLPHWTPEGRERRALKAIGM